MTRGGAESRLRELESEQSLKLCPLTRTTCTRRCECYQPGWITDNEEYVAEGKDLSYYARSPRCTCFALKGPREEASWH